MKKFLRTYVPFATNQIKADIAYGPATILFIICSLFSAFISYFLWQAIYGSAGGGTICGLSMQEMVIYVFMTYVTSATVNISISEDVSFDVVKGDVAMNLIKPISYRNSLLSRGIGHSIYQFVLPGVFVWIGVEIYRHFSLAIPFTGIVNVILYVCSTLMSLMIFMLFEFCFGMIAFFTTYIFGLQMVKSAVLSFLTGQLIPLAFFPAAVQRVFDFLPFSSMTYTPVMIYLGKYIGNELVFALGRQIIWVIILYVIGGVIWNKVTKRLVVLGG